MGGAVSGPATVRRASRHRTGPLSLALAVVLLLGLLLSGLALAATKPVVTAISPNQGPAAGGTSVTISGSGFSGATAVDFGTHAASSFTVNSATTIHATAPAGTGTVAVTVRTPAGTSARVLADQYTYGPTVTAISPNHGPAAGGTRVTISGTSFSGATTVDFGTHAASSFTVNSATTIHATAPTGTGTVHVTVTTAAGTSPKLSADQYTYGPTVTVISPRSGSTLGGTVVTITGTGLSGATTVDFGSTAATEFTVNSAISITATAPAGSGTVDVTVTTPGGSSPKVTADKYTYKAPPVVTSLSPTHGPTAGGTVVTITGTGFSGATAVHFGPTAATSLTVNSATTIHTTAPAGTGTVDVTVTTPVATSATSSVDKFTYGPAVTAISPSSGSTVGGTVVTISGRGFGGATAVDFGSTAAGSYSVVSASSITATAPAGSGTVDVTVTTPAGSSPKSTADAYTYKAPPVVTGLSQSGGPIAGGTNVTISGSGFTGATTVDFGSTPASSFTVNSDTSITATAPAGSGTVDVTVVTMAGTSAIASADQFTYFSPPVVSLGGPLVITGLSVWLNGGVYWSESEGGTISFDPGDGSGSQPGWFPFTYTYAAPGTYTITATAVDIYGQTGTVQTTVTIAPPTVSSLGPSGGPVAGGTSVTIGGSGFTGASAVDFGTMPASSFTVNSDSSITTTAPAGSGTVDVTVSTAAGTSATSTADQFTYYGPPTVTIGQTLVSGLSVALRCCVHSAPGAVTISFNPGDGSPSQLESPAFNYTYAAPGTYTITVTATDIYGQVGTASTTVTVASVPPSASTPGWNNWTFAVSPGARSDASMAYDAADGETVLFGGYDGTGALGDTWIFKGGQWSQSSPTISPSPRYGAAMAYDAADGYVVLFGGFNGSSALGDTWIFKGGQWSQLSPTTSPSPRQYAAMTYDSTDGYVVLFGGDDPISNTYDQDTWIFEAGQWTQLTPSASPSARGAAGLADDPADGGVVLFGGSSDFQVVAGLSDTWIFAAGQWSELSPPSAPVDRDDFSFSYDAATKSDVLFGGWSPSEGSQVDDTWQFSAGIWTQVSSSASPVTRAGAAVAYDASVGGVLLFGGSTGGFGITPIYQSDTWVFGPAQTGGTPPASSSPPAVTTQPQNQTVKAGQTASFTAAASGSPSPTVQWQVSTNGGSSWSALSDGVQGDGSTVSGSASATLTIANVAASANGNQYEAVFTNSQGSAPSNAATLKVTEPPTGEWATVSCGMRGVLAIKTDGTLWAWGDNADGQLGVGDYYQKDTPTQVGTDNDWATVSAGDFYTLAIKTDGTLWAWGDNGLGELGLGTYVDNDPDSPVQVGTDNDWASVYCGAGYAFAIKTDGTLWAWGDNSGGELGIPDITTGTATPTQVGTDNDWASVACEDIDSGGDAYTLALQTDGTLWAWGYNELGELGVGDNVGRATPTQVDPGSTWSAVACGFNHTVAVNTNGTLWGWGYDLNNVSPQYLDAPAQIGTDNDWASVSAGENFSLALTTNGTLWGWGDNAYGEVGQTDTSYYPTTPTQIDTDNDWAAVSCGGFYFSLGLKTNGSLWSWGAEGEGQLGLDTSDGNAHPTPTEVGSASTASSPIVTTQPQNQTASVGKSVSFTAAASGNPTPDVQWYVLTPGSSSVGADQRYLPRRLEGFGCHERDSDNRGCGKRRERQPVRGGVFERPEPVRHYECRHADGERAADGPDRDQPAAKSDGQCRPECQFHSNDLRQPQPRRPVVCLVIRQ